jgi:uncharacterized protein (DUF433 family)
MNTTEFGEYLVMDPKICHGKLTFKNTRVPVETILNRVAKGRTLEEILADWPELSRDAVAEAIRLAAEALLEKTAKIAGKADESTHIGGQPLPAKGLIDLRELGISEAEAAKMRYQFETIADDWERPEMDVYNDL